LPMTIPRTESFACLTASSYAARRPGRASIHSRAAWQARHPASSPVSRVSISELLGGVKLDCHMEMA
jgi:hypothetical protein